MNAHIPPVPTPSTPPPPGGDRLLSGPAARSARLLCRELAAAADSAIAMIDADGDAGLRARHGLRVALRRLRVTLEAYREVLDDTLSPKLPRRVQALARRLGTLRDRDVLRSLLHDVTQAQSETQRAGLAMLTLRDLHDDTAPDIERMRKRWQRIAASLHSGLSSWHEEHRLDGAPVTLPFGVVAADAIERVAARISRRFIRINGPDDVEAMHAARLTLKAARYLLAPLANSADDIPVLIAALRTAQDRLGMINDAHALRSRLRDAMTLQPDRPALARATQRALEACDADLSLRIAAAFDAISDWRTADAADSYIARLRAIAAAWRANLTPPIEIERKWLLSALPPHVRHLTSSLLRQGYLAGDTLIERIRSVSHNHTTRWIRTVKLGRGLSRIEIEEETSAALGEALFGLTLGKRVEKRRFDVQDGDLVWEIDEFTDRELVLAECELPSEDTNVTPPAWLAPYVVREVTGEPEFTNWKLAR